MLHKLFHVISIFYYLILFFTSIEFILLIISFAISFACIRFKTINVVLLFKFPYFNNVLTVSSLSTTTFTNFPPDAASIAVKNVSRSFIVNKLANVPFIFFLFIF